MSLHFGENRVILALAIWSQYTRVTDEPADKRQTDRHRDNSETLQ